MPLRCGGHELRRQRPTDLTIPAAGLPIDGGVFNASPFTQYVTHIGGVALESPIILAPGEGLRPVQTEGVGTFTFQIEWEE